jgi:hypothetical protein
VAAAGPRRIVIVAGLLAMACASQPSIVPVPDLNGTWGHQRVFGIDSVCAERLPDGSVRNVECASQPDEAASFPKYRPEFLAKVAELRDRQVETDTVLRCYPPGVPRIGPPGKIVQTAGEVVFLYNDYNGGYFRLVPLDGARAEQSPSHLGQAVGRFEGDVLVVETTRFTIDTWLTDNGAFHTAELRVVERLRRIGDTIDYEAVAHDPAVLTEPWVARTQTLWRTARELDVPVPCEDRDLSSMTDRSYHENPR